VFYTVYIQIDVAGTVILSFLKTTIRYDTIR